MAAPAQHANQEETSTHRARAMEVLGEVVSSKVRATVLAWAVPRLDTPFSLTELSRAVDSPISSLQHECYKLERLGILQGRREGASRRYRVQLDHRLTRPLIGLVIAALGLERVLADAISEAGTFELALLAGQDPVDGRFLLALIGEADLLGLDRAQQRVGLALGIDPEHIELAYFRAGDHPLPSHPLHRHLEERPIQPIIGTWPPR
jgi:DNA-binding transcriptional ArsR family regulator